MQEENKSGKKTGPLEDHRQKVKAQEETQARITDKKTTTTSKNTKM